MWSKLWKKKQKGVKKLSEAFSIQAVICLTDDIPGINVGLLYYR